jgi:phage antirepressor YoqD-like protein
MPPGPLGILTDPLLSQGITGRLLFLENQMDIQQINTMDSLEIAGRTGKNHADVCRDIRKMLSDLSEPQSRFALGYYDAQGQLRNSYALPKRECLILASGYSVQLRAKIIDRWIELESKESQRPSFSIPQTLSEALRLAADLSDKVEAQAIQLEAQRPAVDFVDRFVEAKETQNLRVVAKVLQVREKDFVSVLLSKGVLFRSRGKLTPKAEHMDSGRFEVKEIVTKGGFATVQMRFTPLGVRWIAGKVEDWGLIPMPQPPQASQSPKVLPTHHYTPENA